MFPCLRGFEEGLADRGGRREEILPVPGGGLFCVLFLVVT